MESEEKKEEVKVELDAIKRPWQCGNKVKIHGVNLMGEIREYEFFELNQEYGSLIFHEYVIIVIQQWDKLRSLLDAYKENLSADPTVAGMKSELLSNFDSILDLAGTVIKFLPEFMSWEQTKRLSELLLSDHSVKCGEDMATAGADGFSGINDPLEIYTALFYSMCANWPKYFGPLLSGLLGGSIQGTENKQQSNEKSAH